MKYIPFEIETKWQKKWEEAGIYKPDLDTSTPSAKLRTSSLSTKKPFYNLMMFPYPSAEGMHVGNMYAFTGSDIYGRFKRMQGFSVFEPIGLDGFGIHSENYAIKVGRHPKEQAKVSEANFYRQLRATGNGFDWSRTLETYDPKYYKWTQWIFIQLFKKGLAYRKKAPVNFCPSCKTVLADEQVIDGKCERCSSLVEKKELEQWFFKITSYADRLLNNLEKLDWTPKVKIAQKEWIGRSEGAQIEFKIQNSKFKILVFTTRPDTLYGATFLVLSPASPWVERATTKEQHQKVSNYIKKWKERDRSELGKAKSGVFTGSYAINPVTKQEIPIWVADYVLMEYGTGAIMGVPAHDQRDFEFAKKYNLKIVEVIKPSEKLSKEKAYDGPGTMVNSGDWNGWQVPSEISKVIDWLEKKGIGKRQVQYHLRDWLISRQRYWGPPIPMIYCEKCNWQPVPEKDLPVLLPDVEDWKPKGTGKSPLANIASFVNTKCPVCKGPAKRETDVSDTFLDSAWYFFRYLGTEFENVPFPSKKFSEYSENSVSQNIGKSDASDDQNVRKSESSEFSEAMKRSENWLPVTMYIGGAEHSVLHLLYSRFLTMVFHDLGLISFEEPYARFYAHGLLIKDGAKMSKSKGNVVVPDKYIEKFGADTLRTYLMFAGPFDQGGDFRDTGIEGMHKFIRRVWSLIAEHMQKDTQKNAEKGVVQRKVSRGSAIAMHRAVKEVTEDMENLRYNTAIAHLMEWYNFLSSKLKVKSEKLTKEEAETFLKLLAPFAPHMAEELWQRMRAGISNFQSIHTEPWPSYDPKFLQEEEAIIVVQVDGKVRDAIRIQNSELRVQSKVEEKAKKSDRVQKYLQEKKVKRVVYVEGKIINFVTE